MSWKALHPHCGALTKCNYSAQHKYYIVIKHRADNSDSTAFIKALSPIWIWSFKKNSLLCCSTEKWEQIFFIWGEIVFLWQSGVRLLVSPVPEGCFLSVSDLIFSDLDFFSFSFLDPMTCCCFYVLQGRQQSTSGCFNDMISHHTKPPPLWPPTEPCWLHLSIRCRCVCVCVSKQQWWQHTASDGSSMPRGQLLLRMPRKNSERKRKRWEGVLLLWCETYPYLC